MRFSFILLTAFSPVALYAADCASLIREARIRSVEVRDSSAVLADAASFCSEHFSERTRERSFSYKVRYEALRGAIGSGSRSEDQVAGKFCSSTQVGRASAFAYQAYVEAIAPGAFEAYSQCVRFTDKEVTFDLQAMEAKDLSVTVSFRPNSRATEARIRVSGSDGIDCSWEGKTLPGAEVRLSGVGAAILKCHRDAFAQSGFVVLARTDGGAASMTIPWVNYAPDGTPVPSLKQLQSVVGSLRESVASLSTPVIAVYSGEKQQANATGSVFDFATRVTDAGGLVQPGSAWKFTVPTDGLYAVSVVFSLPYGKDGSSYTSPYVTCAIVEKRSADGVVAQRVSRHQFDTGCSLSSVLSLDKGSTLSAELSLDGAIAGTIHGYISIARVGGGNW